MLKTKLMDLNINGINKKDETYNLEQLINIKELESTIRKTGFVAPVLVEITQSGFRLLYGFARVNAMLKIGESTIPAVVLEQQLSFQKAFALALQDRMDKGPINPVEVSVIIQRLEAGGVDKNEIVKHFLPEMGYGRNPKVYELHKDLFKLEEPWRQMLNDDQLSLDMAAEIVSAEADVRNAFLEFIKVLRIGKNRQKEFWALVQDIARMENIAIATFLQEPEIQIIVADELLAPAQKSDRIKQLLWEKRYPQYSETENRFKEVLKSVKLPPELVIQHPPFFDGDRYSIMLNISSAEEFQQHLERLQELNEKDVIRKLIDLV